MRNNSVKLFFEFGPVVQTSFKKFLIWSSGGHPAHGGANHLYNFEGAHHGSNSCEVILKIGLVVQDEMLFKEKSLRMDVLTNGPLLGTLTFRNFSFAYKGS